MTRVLHLENASYTDLFLLTMSAGNFVRFVMCLIDAQYHLSLVNAGVTERTGSQPIVSGSTCMSLTMEMFALSC